MAVGFFWSGYFLISSRTALGALVRVVCGADGVQSFLRCCSCVREKGLVRRMIGAVVGMS